MENKLKLVGTLLNKKEISFVLEDFKCVFFYSEPKSAVDYDASAELFGDKHFLICQTSDGQFLYILKSVRLRVSSNLLYIKQVECDLDYYLLCQESNIEEYDEIVFKGGILDKLFFRRATRLDLENKSLTYTDDSVDYPFVNKDGKICIRSNVIFGTRFGNGSYIDNSGTLFSLKFNKTKDLLSSVFYFHAVLKLCQFMAFRKNLSFNSIEIYNHKQRDDKPLRASLYVRYDWQAENDKDCVWCLTFNHIGHIVSNLLDSAIRNDQKGPDTLNIGFIPDSKNDVYLMTEAKVRSVCSALESELALAGINGSVNPEFEKLMKKLKNIVKEHRESPEHLENFRDYDYIFGTIRHMTGSLESKIKQCFEENKAVLDFTLSDENIAEFVKSRNILTHGKRLILFETSLAETTFSLMKLVYCCILKRNGAGEALLKKISEFLK